MNVKEIYKDIKRRINFLSLKVIFCVVNLFSKNNFTTKLYVFSPLPPQKTGTAIYALNLYMPYLCKVKFVSAIENIYGYKVLLKYLPKGYKNCVIPIKFVKRGLEGQKILNMGNSYYHLPYLEYGIKYYGDKNMHITLCETQLFGLIQAYCEKYHMNLKQLLLKYYADKSEAIEFMFKNNCLDKMYLYNIFCIRIIIALTGVRHFIVNREVSKELLLKDLEETQLVKIDIIHCPIAQINIDSVRPKKIIEKGYLIGSFGIAHLYKQTDKIIDAVELLNKRGMCIHLLLAGYDINAYLNSINCKNENLIVVENPNYNELLSLMKSVDLGVQLRGVTQGEASGCIAELLALNKNIIASEFLVDSYIKPLITTVTADCSVIHLADIIEKKLKENNVNDFTEYIQEYSFEKQANKILEKVL